MAASHLTAVADAVYEAAIDLSVDLWTTSTTCEARIDRTNYIGLPRHEGVCLPTHLVALGCSFLDQHPARPRSLGNTVGAPPVVPVGIITLFRQLAA